MLAFIKKVLSLFTVSGQQQAVGGRRVWAFCVGMIFVLVAHFINIPDNLVYGALSLGGAFIVGESARDVAAAKK